MNSAATIDSDYHYQRISEEKEKEKEKEYNPLKPTQNSYQSANINQGNCKRIIIILQILFFIFDILITIYKFFLLLFIYLFIYLYEVSISVPQSECAEDCTIINIPFHNCIY